MTRTSDEQEAPVLLVPNVYDSNVAEDEDAFSLSYDLFVSVNALDWSGDLLALAHNDGISVLTPIPKDTKIAKSLPSPFQQSWIFQVTNVPLESPVNLLKFTSKYIAASHNNHSITLINHLDQSQVKLGGDGLRGHHEEINSIDISENGVVVSSSDDGTVIVWENGEARVFQLDGIATLVKNWIDQDGDKIIVVENGSAVKILNWRQKKFLYTIYPFPYSENAKPFINDVVVHNGDIVVIGDGWTKRYDVDTLTNGAGYTDATEESQLGGWLVGSQYVSSKSKPLIGGVTSEKSSFYDLNTNSNQIHSFKLTLPSVEVNAGSINQNGLVAIASGSKLILAHPFDSYEALQYTK